MGPWISAADKIPTDRELTEGPAAAESGAAADASGEAADASGEAALESDELLDDVSPPDTCEVSPPPSDASPVDTWELSVLSADEELLLLDATPAPEPSYTPTLPACMTQSHSKSRVCLQMHLGHRRLPCTTAHQCKCIMFAPEVCRAACRSE